MTETRFELRDLIEARIGILFRDQAINFLTKQFEARIERLECGSLANYQQLLMSEEPAGAAEWRELSVLLTKPISGFYRHDAYAQLLVNTIIPRLDPGEGGALTIWSAGCATGEEPLSIALALAEAGWFDRLPIGIRASDLSQGAIEKARKGVYPERRVAAFTPERRDKYFLCTEGCWSVVPELHRRIEWSIANLANESEIGELATAPVIFCRNVFIYFSESAICRTLRLFAERMPAGGYLITDQGDYFESLMARVGNFDPEKFDGITIWRKRKLAPPA